MDSPDSPGRGLIHSLNAVVSWLHSEGFYAAEETLLREIENRYPAPDAVSPRSTRGAHQPSGSPGSSGDVGAAGGDLLAAGASAARDATAAAGAASSGARSAGRQPTAFAAYQHLPAQQLQPPAQAPQQQQQQQPEQRQQHQEGQEDTVDFMPALQLAAAHSLTPVDSMESAEKVLEAWRSKSTTPAASPKKAAGLSPPPSPPLPWSLGKAASDLDEYENEDDPGYQRMDVVGQEAALGLELDHMSEASTAAAGDALYHQLQQYEALSGDLGFPSHARHASIDMGLLNRQLHGGASRSSASSSQQRAHSKQQQRRQASTSAAQPLLLHEAVTSGEHWRSCSSGQLLLPPGVPGSASVGRERQQQDSQQQVEEEEEEQQQQQQQQQAHQQRQGSPGGSEGGASYCSGEIVGSPGHPSRGYQRSDSYAQRQAGTAQWVYDRANSVDADAYRSLLGHLERPSTGQSTPVSQPPASPPGPAGIPEPEPPQASASLEQQQGQGSSLTMRQLQQSEQAGQQSGREEQEVCSPLYHQESISRVSSLGESMLQEAAALCLSDAPEPLLGPQPQPAQPPQQQPGRPPRPPEQPQRPGEQQQQQQQHWERPLEQPPQQHSPPQQQGNPPIAPQGAGAQAAAAATAAAWAAAGRAAQQQAQQAHQQQVHQPAQQPVQLLPLDEIEVLPAEPATITPPRLAKHLPALRLGGGHQLGSSGRPGSGNKLGSRKSVSTAADTTGADRGSEGECSSPHGSSAHTPDGASIIDYSDPFSFPVTPPSEVAPPPDPAPLFGSWASLKSSPDRKGGLGGYGTEDESTPARRRYQQQAAAAAVAAAAAAKEQGGVQRSIKFPPLGGPGGLAPAGSGMLHGYGSSSQLLSYATPSQPLTDDELGGGGEFDQEYFDRKYEVINLKVIHRRHSTGFEQARELPLHIGDLIAGRYQIVDLLGQAAFSRAVQALDLRTGALVCLKIIKNNKDYFDQGLDEVKLLRYVNAADPGDESGLLRLHDFFYFKEHLVLVTELLRANLYEFQKYNRESGDEPYFTLPRMQSIARQVLTSLSFLHSLGLVHADLKPENILVKSYSRCQVKVIDLGSSCYLSDHLSSYVQSRSYRAPEVILGLAYDHKIDLWSLGCILAELATGRVLFQNDSVATLLARLEGILGPLPRWMLHRGRYAHKYFVRDGRIFEKNPHTGRYEFLRPKATSLARRVPQADEGMLSFLKCLLQPDPSKRPTAAEALQHPWLRQAYYAA